MQLENMRLGAVLVLFAAMLVPASHATNPCSTCFATYIGLTEANGTINATVFMVNSTMVPVQNLSFFDREVEKYFSGAEGTPDLANTPVVNTGLNISSIANADIYFFFYNRTGGKENVTGCTPVKATYYLPPPAPDAEPFYYAACTIPKSLYANSSVTIYAEYRGNQTTKPSQREITVYDVSAGGLNVLASAMQKYLDPTRSECLAGLIMLGVLLASMYFSGKSPLSYMDITVPRVPKPKAIGFGPLIAGAGNVRLGMPYMLESKFLDALIKRHSKIDFRANPLRRDIENAIENSKASALKKYFARAEAARGGDWAKILGKEADERTLVRDAEKGRYGSIANQLLMVMNQRVTVGQASQAMGRLLGDQNKAIGAVMKRLRRWVPLVGPFLSVASTSISYGLRTSKYMAQAAASKPVRMVMGGKYGELTRLEEEQKIKPTGITKKLYEIASMTDTKKMVVGKLFPLHAYAERFYEDTRDALYEEVVRNILWNEIYEQLRQRLGAERAKALLLNQLDFKSLFRGDDGKGLGSAAFIRELGNLQLPAEYLEILRRTHNPDRTPTTFQQRAELLLDAARRLHPHFDTSEFGREANAFYKEVWGIAHNDRTAYDKAEGLVKFVRQSHMVDKPHDLTEPIISGKFFITTGRNNLYYEQDGIKKNFGFVALALREYTDQVVFLGSTKSRPDSKHFMLDEQRFTVADAFKLAWLKLTSNVFGHRDWYLPENDLSDRIAVTDPTTGKPRQVSFMKQILGMQDSDLSSIGARMRDYMHSLLTPDGVGAAQEVMEKQIRMGKKVASYKECMDDLLYGYDIRKVKEKEETTRIPWKRYQWYYLESESYPDQKYWRANMNFTWTSIGTLDRRDTLVHGVRGYKYWANMPRPENAWSLMENFMDTRLANMMNGTQWDFFGYERRDEQFRRFNRVDAQKYFNETWDFYSKVKDGLGSFYETRKGMKPASNSDLMEFLKEEKNQKITYDMLRNGKTPFIYTHDFSYIPYVKGMPVSDFDRIINGVFVLEDEKGRRTFDFNRMAEYRKEFQTPEGAELQAILTSLQKLKKAPSAEDIKNLENALNSAGIALDASSPAGQLLARLNRLVRLSSDAGKYVADVEDSIASAETLRRMAKGLSISDAEKFRLLGAIDSVDPNLQPMRALSEKELETIRNALGSSRASAEAKTAFLYQFSNTTHDWQSLWGDAEFLKLVPEKDLDAAQRGWLGKFLVRKFGEDSAAAHLYEKLAQKAAPAGRMLASDFEAAVYGAGKVEAESLAANVAVSELYRERSHDMRMRIKGGGFLNGLNVSAEDMKVLEKSYDDYANVTQRFFIGWMDGITRDPRGSSTQWGRQWYLNTMYHRGGAMHPESHEFGGERTFLSPMGWFLGQTFHRASSANWMFGSPFVRMVRGFQTAMFGYPTIWDKNFTPAGEFDAMQPWQMPTYSNFQKFRALLNPAESVFSLQNFSIKRTISRSMQMIPGLNMLSYFFPSLDPAIQGGPAVDRGTYGKTLGDSEWYRQLSQIPGLRSVLQQSHTQRSQRAGIDLVNALKQKPEDFLQYKAGGFVHHFTDSANPGVSYVDYTGRGRLAARIGSYLVNDVVSTSTSGDIDADTKKWRDFYKSDEYVRMQSNFSMAKRGIAAEIKRLQFQQELTGYGPGSNPMWAPLSTPTLFWWMQKWLRSKDSLVASGLWAASTGAYAAAAVPAFTVGAQSYEWWKGRGERRAAAKAAGQPPPAFQILEPLKAWAKKKYANMSTDIVVCPHCNAVLVARGRICPNCKRYPIG